MEESGSSGADGTGQGFICLCSISGDADRWMYGCTQLLPWNNVITPINSHVTLDPPAGPETRIPPTPPFSFHSFCSQRRGYAVSLFSHAGDRSAEFGVNNHVPDQCILKLNPPPHPHCSRGQLQCSTPGGSQPPCFHVGGPPVQRQHAGFYFLLTSGQVDYPDAVTVPVL